MIKDQKWVWQLSEWPKFVYDGKLLAPALAEAHWMHGMLAGKSQTIGFEGVQQIALDALVDEVISTAAIEGCDSLESLCTPRWCASMNSPQAGQIAETSMV